MGPLVSVIMPAFNTAVFIERAIASALGQTWRNLEVIVVDDGSADQTVSVVERIAGRDARVRLYRQANGGASRARNRAMSEARGAFFALLDSDDEWMPEYLVTQLAVLEREPAVSVVTANAWNRGGAFDGEPYWPLGGGLERLTLTGLIEQEDAVSIMAVFRREVHAAIGGYDESFVRGSEDYDFWLRAASAGFGFARQRRPLAYYQRRPESLSANHADMLSGILASLGKARSRHAADGAVCTAIDRQLLRFRTQRLDAEGALALRQHRFGLAAERFAAVHASRGGPRAALVASWCRFAPTSLLMADAVRRWMRRSTANPSVRTGGHD